MKGMRWLVLLFVVSAVTLHFMGNDKHKVKHVAAHDTSALYKNRPQQTSTTTLATTTMQAESTVARGSVNSPSPTNTTTTEPYNDDDVSSSDLAANLNAAPSPYDANTTTYLKQLSGQALMAFLTGPGRANFPILWPSDTSGSDANFKTAQIDGAKITGSGDNASILVYWQSSDLPSTNSPQSAIVTAQLINHVWQITNIQT